MAHKPVPPSDSVAAILQRSETAAARWRKAGRVAEATVVEDLLELVRRKPTLATAVSDGLREGLLATANVALAYELAQSISDDVND